jgi:hypothetical protein
MDHFSVVVSLVTSDWAYLGMDCGGWKCAKGAFYQVFIPTLSEAEGEGSASCGELQLPRFARDENSIGLEA